MKQHCLCMKKSQVTHTVFYVFGIIIIALLLTAGLRYLSQTSAQHQQLLLVQFEQALRGDVQRLNGQYGYIQTIHYDLPSTYQKICFLDLSERTTLIQSPSLAEYSALRDAASTPGSLNNVFLLGEDLISYTIPNVSLTTYPYYTCQKINRGRIELTLEGTGRKTLVLTNLTTTLHLDATQEQHLLSADGMVELILPLGVTINPAVPDIFIQIMPPTNVTSTSPKKTEVYKFGPDDLQFSPAITLRMHYFPEILTQKCPSKLVYHSFHADGTPKKDYDSTHIDCSQNVATFLIDGFSSGHVGEEEGACDLSCLSFSTCTDTGAQMRLCNNPSSCELNLAVLNDLLDTPCVSFPASCTDGVKNQNEIGVDCGGVCEACAGETCMDGVKNQDETDKDCAGICDPCSDGKDCLMDADCDHLHCESGSCVSCFDADQNQDESDLDCGGVSCDPCVNGKQCNSPSDCVSGNCVNNICQAPCSETLACDNCMDKANSQACDCNAECQNNYCDANGKCKTLASCMNTQKDGQETDIDCGGSSCPLCKDKQSCLVKEDCESDVCEANTCVSCSDGFKNQDEGDIDCGGSCTIKCINDKTCNVHTDCQSNYCDPATKKCTNPLPSCIDGVKNQDEADKDCGGATCNSCLNGMSCVFNSDCQSNYCDPATKKCANPPPTCMDSQKNGQETDVDCGGSSCQKCADKKSCLANLDCVNNKCETNKCVSCNDGFKNQDETDIDCGGLCTTKCVNGKTCKIASDCQSNNCVGGKCQNSPPTTKTFTADKAQGGWTSAFKSSTNVDWANIGRGPFNAPVDMDANPRRDFLYFDTSSIPATATVTNATLTLQGPNYADNGCPNVAKIDIYQCNFYPLDTGDFSTSCSKNPTYLTLKGLPPTTLDIQPSFITKAGKTQFRLQSQDEGCTKGTTQNYGRICLMPPGWDATKCTTQPLLRVTYTS